MKSRYSFNALVIVITLAAAYFIAAKSESKVAFLAEAAESASTRDNFDQDLSGARDYWSHNKSGRGYSELGDYENAIMEYKKAIEIINNMPGDEWPNLKKEDVDRINQQSRIDAQIFSRYRLIENLDKVGRYEEALENIKWLKENQIMKGKEEFLKQKLEGMKQSILQKIKRGQILP